MTDSASEWLRIHELLIKHYGLDETTLMSWAVKLAAVDGRTEVCRNDLEAVFASYLNHTLDK